MRVAVVLVLASAMGAWAAEPQEVFVPVEFPRAASVELRSQSTIEGPDVHFKQLARWSDADATALEQTQDLVVYRFDGSRRSVVIDLDQVKAALEQAGVKLACLQFSGSNSCIVKRIDTRMTIAAEQGVLAQIQAMKPATTQPVMVSFVPPANVASQPSTTNRTLKEILISDLTNRMGIAPDRLVLRMSGIDEKLSGLSEPMYRFTVTPRQRRIGDVTWDVIIATDAGEQKAAITANVKVWQNQVTTARAVAFKQVFREEDLAERRMLMDRVEEDTNLRIDQVVGQQAGRDLGPGVVLNSHIIQPVQLVKMGQLITVTVERGAVQLKWVAEAREPGSAGQTIRVRKPATREEFMVVLTGPEEGKLTLSPSTTVTNVALNK